MLLAVQRGGFGRDDGGSVEFRDVVAALRTSWWVVVLGGALGVASTLGLGLAQPPLYTSTTQFFVSTTGAGSATDVFQGSQFSQQRVSSYAELLTGAELAQRVIDVVELDLTPSALSSQITATVVPNTVLIDVAVVASSPESARRVAGAIGDEFIAMVEELETPRGGGASPVAVAVTDPPDLPDQPSSPRLLRDAALGGAAGVAIGVLMVLLRARLDRSVKDPGEVAELAGAPVIGTILRDDQLAGQRRLDRVGLSHAAEDYRHLRNNLQFLRVDDPPKVIMITSAMPSEGKTTAVINLAFTLADVGRRVTIVEADLRKPRVTRYLGLVGDVGLTNVLSGVAGIEDVLQKYGTSDLHVLAAGPIPPNPGELLASTHMQALIEKLKEENDFVLVDAPPLLPVADSTGLAVGMDGVLLSVRYGSTRKEQVEAAAGALNRVGARTLGVILNIVTPKADAAVGRGYGYSYDERVSKSNR
ncbi:polysaccharide biosynthesis tyrosine autokinase [Trujillonella humicola]|uniref:polysaccharide biosynthesis tyrosine autokinase n=1 Tax=Trujillonella humicola TaxID=3383699 RepID=UPI0039068E4C